MIVKTLILSTVALLAAGCASNQNDLSPNFGKSYTANAAAQIIDPTPAVGAPEGDGAAVDLAVARYKTDTVKKGDSGDFSPEDETKEGAK
jgi:type IV pilus biogenesis protein CpaD/CtpE